MTPLEGKNLPGYCDEIPYPRDKKDELISCFAGFTVEVHTNAEDEFGYLEDDDYTLIIKNPYHDEDIEIELADEFSLFFGGWHTHYCSYVYDYNQMIDTARAIMSNRKYAMLLRIDGEWYGSFLEDNPVSLEELLSGGFYEEDQLEIIRNKTAELEVHCWKP